MKIFTFIFALLFCFCQCVHSEEVVLMHISVFCTDQYYDLWKVFGKVSGENKQLYETECKQHSGSYETNINITRTDDLIYSVQFIDALNGGSSSIFTAYDKYEIPIIKVSGHGLEHPLYYFNYNNPIELGSDILFEENNVSDDWYKLSFNPENWKNVIEGSSKESNNNDQYYRKTFNLDEASKYAGYILQFNFFGQVEIYLNEQLIWNGQKVDTTDPLDFGKLILSGAYLKNTNLLAIHIQKDTIQNYAYYINIAISLLYGNELDHKCAYYMPAKSYVSTLANNPKYFFDRIYTTTSQAVGSNHTIGVLFTNNTYMQIGAYNYYANNYIGYSPDEFTLEGKYTDDSEWNIIDYETKYYPVVLNTTFYVSANQYLFNQIQFHTINMYEGENAVFTELLLFTCNFVSNEFHYSQTNYDIKVGYPIDIAPVETSFSSFKISPELPEGLMFNTINGHITGSSVTTFGSNTYTISASYPIFVSATIQIASSLCSTAHIIVRYSIGINSDYNTFAMVNSSSNETVFEIKPYQRDAWKNKYYDYELCVDYGNYRLEYDYLFAGMTKSWSSKSLIQIYQAPSTEISYGDLTYLFVPIYTGRLEVQGSHNYYVNLNSILDGYSDWMTIDSSVPDDWFAPNFDDSHWTTMKLGSEELKPVLRLFRNNFIVNTYDPYGSVDIYIKYVGGIILYINGNKIMSRYIKGELTKDTTAFGTYDDLKYRRITVPFSSMIHGKNNIAIAYAPYFNNTQTLSFDVTMRYAGNGDRFAFDGYKMSSMYSEAFDYDYSTSGYIPTTEPFIIKPKNDDFTYVTSYAMYGSGGTKEQRPISFVLEGRQYDDDDSQPWTILDERSNIYWPYNGYRQIFFVPFTNKNVYNQIRIRDVQMFPYNSMTLYEFEFFSNSYVYDYPLFYYEYTPRTTYYYTYINEMLPLYNSYYHNFEISPALPSGITFDSTNGHIKGIPTEYTSNTLYTVKAMNIMNQYVSTILTINFEYCSNGQNIMKFGFHTKFSYTAPKVSVNVFHKLDGTGSLEQSFVNLSPIYKDDFYKMNNTSYLDVTYIYCLPEDYYTIKYKNDIDTGLQLPYGFTISNIIDTNIISTSIPSNTATMNIYYDNSSPIQTNETLWYYMPSQNYTLDWLDKHFDLSNWSTTKGGIVNTMEMSYLYMRSYFSIEDTNIHSSLDFRFSCYGSISIYINKELMYSKTISDSTLHQHVFTYYIQGHAIKNNNNIIGLILETPTSLHYNQISIDMAYIYGTCSRYLEDFTVHTNSTFSEGHEVMNLFDNSHFTYTEFISEDKQMDITFNEEKGFIFNSLYFQTYNSSYPQYISIYGKEKENYDWIPLLQNGNITITTKATEKYFDVLPGIIGYKYIRIYFHLENEKNPLILTQMAFAYCRSTMVLCPSIDDYPVVGEDRTSYKLCGYGYQGYKQRECDGLSLDTIDDNTHCTYLAPTDLSYDVPTMTLVTYHTYSFEPTFTNYITHFSVTPDLPLGLSLNSETGIISGTPSISNTTIQYIITGSNPTGKTHVILSIAIEEATCVGYDEYPTTTVRTIASLTCPPGYMGYRQRPCIYNENTKNVVWGDTEDYCSSTLLIVGSICSVILTLCIIILAILCYRTNKKNKEEIRKLHEHIAKTQKEKINKSEKLQI